jgi:hypothetical protein
MSVTLSQQLELYYDTLKAEGWSLALREVLGHRPNSPELLEQLRNECLNIQIETKEEYLKFAKSCLALLLLYDQNFFSPEKKIEFFSSLYLKLCEVQYPEEWQLATLYKALIGLLLGEKVEDIYLHVMESGVTLREYKGHFPEEHLPHFIKNGELAVLGLILSSLTSNPVLLKKTLKLVYWLASFLQEDTMFPEGLWMKEDEYSLSSLCFINALAFQGTSALVSSPSIDQAYHFLQKKIEGFTPRILSSLESVYPLLQLFLMKCLQESSLTEKMSMELKEIQIESERQHALKPHDQYLGYGGYQYDDFSCYCSASGVGSGYACLRKGSVDIVSIGPHFPLLGEMKNYGIYRTPMMKQTPFKDIKMEKSTTAFSFKGWTRVIQENSLSLRPGDCWIYIDLQAKGKRCEMQVRWMNGKATPELLLAFFVKADKVIIDKSYHLQPHTLDRYQGKATEVCFQKKESSLQIKNKEKCLVQVVPLAGDNHFWGAQFLVAYALPKDQETLFEIF